MSIGKSTLYAYVFENKGFYKVYTPHGSLEENQVVDEDDFYALCKKDPLYRGVTFLSLHNIPAIGKKLDCEKNVFQESIDCPELNELKSVGKIELEKKFGLKRRCSLLPLSEMEEGLTTPELIKKARLLYLECTQIKESVPVKGSPKMKSKNRYSQL